MVADKCEHYEISSVPDGLQIVSWQALPNLGFGLVTLVILAACYLTDPYLGHGRTWAGLWVIVLALVALFGVRVERWIISDSLVRYKNSFWNKELFFERSAGTPLILRVERAACDPEVTEPTFLQVAQVIGESGTEFGGGFQFRKSTNLDRFLETLGDVTPLEITNGSSIP